MLRRFIEAARIASARRYRPVLTEMEGGAAVDAKDELHESDIAAWCAACSYYHQTRPEPVTIHRRCPDARRLGWFHAFLLAWTCIADTGPRRCPASGAR